MAELHVQPKSSKPWWLWLLLALVVIGLLYFFLRDRGTTDNDDDVDTTSTGQTTALLTPAQAPNFAYPFSRYA